jgi:hypothetical protein
MVLTVQPTDIQPMTAAVLQAMSQDPAFAARIETSVRRVLATKNTFSLLPKMEACDPLVQHNVA